MVHNLSLSKIIKISLYSVLNSAAFFLKKLIKVNGQNSTLFQSEKRRYLPHFWSDEVLKVPPPPTKTNIPVCGCEFLPYFENSLRYNNILLV